MSFDTETTAVFVAVRVASMTDARLPRRPIDVSANVGVVVDGKALGINVAGVAGTGSARAVAMRLAGIWLADNPQALASSNVYLEAHGLPFEDQGLYE